MDELRFDGRSVIVTGGGSGFGRCHALLLASRGARVVVADYGVELDGSGSSPEPAEQVAKEIAAAGGEAVACFANVADEGGASSIVQTALDSFGGLDIVVNNAGIWDGDWIEGVSTDQFRRMVDYHYLGTVYVSKAAWPHLKAAEHGCIVNTSSEAMIGHIPKSPDYAGAKGAVFSFTKALALNGKRHGLRVNAVAPRGNTRMSTAEILARTFDQPVENFVGEFYTQMRPEYVSPAVAFLAHDTCRAQRRGHRLRRSPRHAAGVIETKGLTFTDTVTPEDLAENVDALMDPTDAQVVGLDMWD